MNVIRYGLTPLEYTRLEVSGGRARLSADPEAQGPAIPKTIFGNFLEHLGFAIQGGLWAQALSNPVFERSINLLPAHIETLLEAGKRLVSLYQQGGDPQTIPLYWTPFIEFTGFGVAALDDARAENVPFPWAPMGAPGSAQASLGRLGGAIRLRCAGWEGSSFPGDADLEHTPGGVRQGIFLPVHRCSIYEGSVWARIASVEADIMGRVEIGLRRRLSKPGSPAGEILARQEIEIHGPEWEKHAFRLPSTKNKIDPGEPVDFYLRWISDTEQPVDLLVDTIFLFPEDAVSGFDPEVIALAKDWPVPLLRWPGGNFVSHYHWRDGVGPSDLRPTRPNYAWYGLETNFFGTGEFIQLCRLIGAEAHITVNTGTGTPEEAADWVEFCNGDANTRMGKLRAAQGDVEPYGVQLWEVGNETYGYWQGGYHGAEENARRFVEFAQAMRAVDPAIELIATGNSFDFAAPGPGYDHAHADQRWHKKLIESAGEEVDYIGLHSLPANDRFLERLNLEETCYSLMAQLVTWERRFLPDLLRRCDQVLTERAPMRLAITEWGILGARKDRPYVDTFGEAIYAAMFLNLMIRNAARIPVANATALLHGGCIHKVGEKAYTDPQYLVIQKYAELSGARALACHLEAPGYDVLSGADAGAPETDVPHVDSVVCWGEDGLTLAVVNTHLSRLIDLRFALPSLPIMPRGSRTTMAADDPLAKPSPVEAQPFELIESSVAAEKGEVALALPAFSVTWVHFPKANAG